MTISRATAPRLPPGIPLVVTWIVASVSPPTAPKHAATATLLRVALRLYLPKNPRGATWRSSGSPFGGSYGFSDMGLGVGHDYLSLHWLAINEVVAVQIRHSGQ